MKYQFDFSTMTVGDAAEFVEITDAGNAFPLARFADRFTVGGCLHLPFSEMRPFMQAFFAAITAHAQQYAPPESPDLAPWRRAADGEAA